MLKSMYDNAFKTLDTIMPHIIFDIPAETIEDCAIKFNLSEDDLLTLGNPAKESLFFDYCLFHAQVQKEPLVEAIIDNLEAEFTDTELTTLNAYKSARFSVLKVESVLNEGAITVFDFLQEKPYLLFSDEFSAIEPRDLIVCHLIDLNDFVMATGPLIQVIPESRKGKMILGVIAELDAQTQDEHGANEMRDCVTRVCHICLSTEKEYLV